MSTQLYLSQVIPVNASYDSLPTSPTISPPTIDTTTPLPQANDRIVNDILYNSNTNTDALGFLGTNLWMSNLIHSFIVSMYVVIISEMGDKTFFITAIMAVRNSRLLVFLASSLALLTMTILSVCLGVAVTVIPKLYTQYASVVLFFCFGLKMLKEACEMNEDGSNVNSEYTDARREIEERDAKSNQNVTSQTNVENKNTVAAFENAGSDDFIGYIEEKVDESTNDNSKAKLQDNLTPPSGNLARLLSCAPVIFNVYTMIFIAEWGDRSQLSTIILAAKEDATGVFLGSFAGHVLCNGLAVIGGRFFAEIISVRTMNIIGSITFLCFGAYNLYEVLV